MVACCQPTVNASGIDQLDEEVFPAAVLAFEQKDDHFLLYTIGEFAFEFNAVGLCHALLYLFQFLFNVLNFFDILPVCVGSTGDSSLLVKLLVNFRIKAYGDEDVRCYHRLHAQLRQFVATMFKSAQIGGWAAKG